MTKNLLKETIAILAEHGHTLSDIEWVGGNDFEISIDLFKKLANHDYDAGFGAQKVAADLMLVGKDFWLERHEYDGAESWDFKVLPTRPAKTQHITHIMDGYWDSLYHMNFEREYSDEDE